MGIRPAQSVKSAQLFQLRPPIKAERHGIVRRGAFLVESGYHMPAVESEIRKAAVLLMSLPEDQAGSLMGKLSPKQVEAVSIEIAKIGRVPNDEQEAVINEFAEINPSKLGTNAGGIDLAKSLVERALGKDAGDTLDNVRQTIEALPFGFLKKVDPQHLLTFIADEHPQTIAVILSHLEIGRAHV